MSSTYYDLKHVRSSLETFVDQLGFEAILSEKGKVAYTPDLPLDESCYREVGTADIFVLIIGGRYGSEASATKTQVTKTFFERYNSVTRLECRAAIERDIPMYVLIERPVYAEYETYLRNKQNAGVAYAHVDSVNVFAAIDEILTLPRNNPVQQFDRYSEIETWLREQWSGLFRELLQRTQTQVQMASLQAQVAALSELNKTLKTYLEEIVSRIAPLRESASIIKAETKRLHDAGVNAALKATRLAFSLEDAYGVPIDVIREAGEKQPDLASFLRAVQPAVTDPRRREDIAEAIAAPNAHLRKIYAEFNAALVAAKRGSPGNRSRSRRTKR